MPDFPLHYPEEYRQWEVEFFWKKFFVDENVLIPRLETEVLIRRARTILREKSFSKIIDIGSGSGIIGISLADFDAEIHFVDISKNALEITRKNFFKNISQKNATFWQSHLLKNISLKNTDWNNILIVSNLPYIKNDDWKNMSEDTIFEPKIALFGWEETGFELYEQLFFQLQSVNISGMALIEFGFDQRNIAENFFANHFPHWKVQFFSDYRGIERFAEIIF